jgi:ParB family chromosome partitioning protein
MAKTFAARVSKKDRQTIDLAEKLGDRAFRVSDEKLLKGARSAEVFLKDIKVKEQVRTKFNDESLRDLAENIRLNGLIQPLVVHREGAVYTLICGERRFRAMKLISIEKAQCYILENKTTEELLAIQFSENSSREELHYVDKANGITNYKNATNATEREIEKALSMSKSEVHRGLLISKLPEEVKEAAKKYDIEKYVLLEFDALFDSQTKQQIKQQIERGLIRKRSELKKAISGGFIGTRKEGTENKRTRTKSISAAALIKAMSSKSKDLDPEIRSILLDVVGEAKDSLEI